MGRFIILDLVRLEISSHTNGRDYYLFRSIRWLESFVVCFCFRVVCFARFVLCSFWFFFFNFRGHIHLVQALFSFFLCLFCLLFCVFYVLNMINLVRFCVLSPLFSVLNLNFCFALLAFLLPTKHVYQSLNHLSREKKFNVKQ